MQTEENFDPSFTFEYRGPVQMKGKAEPMNVYFLLRNTDSPNNIESLSTVTMTSGGGRGGDKEMLVEASDVNVDVGMDMTVTSAETGHAEQI